MQQIYLQRCNAQRVGDFANRRSMSETQVDKELIQALMDWAGKSPSELARTAKLTPSTLTRPLNQPVKHRLSVPTLAKLRTAFPTFPGFMIDADLPLAPSGKSYLSVEVLPSFGGMGGGGTGEGDTSTALVSRELIEDVLRAKPEDLLLIDVRGDSNEPEFLHGDQILVDRRDVNPVQPGFFALWDGDAYVVKLVERVPRKAGAYRIFSANSRYSEYEVSEDEIRIMGRPVWFARRL